MPENHLYFSPRGVDDKCCEQIPLPRHYTRHNQHSVGESHGLVAETDSMLSSNGVPVLAAGQKLYKADDHTVYMIASSS